MQRRTLLTASTALLTTTLAGCSSDSDGDDGSGNGNDNGNGGNNSAETETATDTPASDGEGDAYGVPADSQPAIQASDVDAQGNDGSLEIAFNARTYTRLEDGNQFWEAENGDVYLLGQYQVQNVGEQAVDVLGGQIVVLADDTEGEWTVVKDGSRFRVTLEPGDELNEWLVHTMPEGASDVTVSYEATEDIAATVEHDESIEFTFPET